MWKECALKSFCVAHPATSVHLVYTVSQFNACLNLDKAQNVILFPLHPVLVIKNNKKDKKQRAIRSVSLSNRLSAWILSGLLLLRHSVIDLLQVTNCSRSGCCFCLLTRDTLMFYVLSLSLRKVVFVFSLLYPSKHTICMAILSLKDELL